MKKRSIIWVLALGAILAFKNDNKDDDKGKEKQKTSQLAKFEPAEDKCLVIVGQDLGAIGGLEKYNDGYWDHFKTPAGFTGYTNFRPGDESFGHTYKGTDGVTTVDNWGSGDCNMQMELDDPDFKNSVLAIGLELVNHEAAVAAGERDSMMLELGKWIKSLHPRPVFLRIGYEFDGPWNHYDSKQYVAAFKHIRKAYDKMGIENVAYVWQCKGYGTTAEKMLDYYPGDEFVDWCSYSHFASTDGEMIKFAREHKKPVFIAEATPMIVESGSTAEDVKFKEVDFDDPKLAEMAWEKWFKGFISIIEQNKDVIKAFSYINVDWRSQAMWQKPPFSMIDSRIQQNATLKERWTKEMEKPNYIHASSTLFDELWHKK